MSLEPFLIRYCSPTLANLKVGSLFSVLSPVWEDLKQETCRLNGQLKEKGLILKTIPVCDRRALCYVYRRSQLLRMLSRSDCAAFLREQGYTDLTEEAVLDRLIGRISGNPEFPHEIGLFLGYPLSDVVAFIRHKGQDCLCCGCWKAYTNECEARKTFARFEKCTRVYCRLYDSGITINRLTVAA